MWYFIELCLPQYLSHEKKSVFYLMMSNPVVWIQWRRIEHLSAYLFFAACALIRETHSLYFYGFSLSLKVKGKEIYTFWVDIEH